MSIGDFYKRAADYAAAEFLRKSAIGIEDGASVIRDFIGPERCRHILEIGTYRGVTAAYFSDFADIVTTIDLKNGKMERDAQVFDRVRFWQAMGRNNIMLHLVESEAEKAKVVDRLDFDFAFVDGDHRYDGVAADFEKVRRCGRVLFHDYTPGNDVFRFIGQLPSSQVRTSGIFAYWQG